MMKSQLTAPERKGSFTVLFCGILFCALNLVRYLFFIKEYSEEMSLNLVALAWNKTLSFMSE